MILVISFSDGLTVVISIPENVYSGKFLKCRTFDRLPTGKVVLLLSLWRPTCIVIGVQSLLKIGLGFLQKPLHPGVIKPFPEELSLVEDSSVQ